MSHTTLTSLLHVLLAGGGGGGGGVGGSSIIDGICPCSSVALDQIMTELIS